MIPRTADWKNALANAVRDPAELLALLELPQGLLPGAREAAARFPLRVPRGYLSRIRKGDLTDPLLRQVLPLAAEQEAIPGFSNDPVGDQEASAARGVLHKYHGRVLLTATGACAIHCRYCFRRHFPYAEENPGRQNWQGIIDYLRAHPEVDELILSGGDPLMLDTPQLEQLTRRLEQQPQLKRLRLHTRLPVVLPERIDQELLGWLARLPWQPVMVIHCNHPAEIDAEVTEALGRLDAAGVTLLNQSVLLHGVNDDEQTLLQLHESLFRHRVMPYYLHLLDRVSGAAHFEVGQQQAEALLERLRAFSPGYLVPKLVREIQGEPNKRPVA
ncbi:MAG: EF-P beta-lysylation protein EpmB [Gammaproteobacteria bacterium]|nr:EF-P beta-lysylation protein EpmB [Gammaproteobacteria bacterium]MCW8841355.1 EF-P beta-lysylation protein EpmB [Gammaproteobacteria bacterium]MCW8959868.1 EF-P beta-lysylation protein EpmB [Gammaproteobacteria bacterium]MCW8973440.1 EF-P beta-lysylation protein EpmB [Gammaproteobacteria bacterium]MCW8991640.1 EF-P beta-lysylation protein EpmB [Gammaproteobacteria bacterium]